MAEIGQYNALKVVREAVPGLYLDGEELGEILLPKRYIPSNGFPGETVEVFIYRDSEDRLVATTENPRATVGEFAGLKVSSVNPRMGAFLDWGLSKDLLVPNREQIRPLRVGETVVVYVLLDPQSQRIIGTTRLEGFLHPEAPASLEGKRVQLLIAEESKLGYKAILETAHFGLLYKTDLGVTLQIGQQVKGFVRTVRPDGKLDLSLDRAGYTRVAPLGEHILTLLKAKGGRLEFDDQSSPEEIREAFGASKKAFKQAIGALYKERKIRMSEGGIELVAE